MFATHFLYLRTLNKERFSQKVILSDYNIAICMFVMSKAPPWESFLPFKMLLGSTP